MHKKTIAAFAAFLAALTLCASCGKQAKSPYGKVIVDKRGIEHVVMTDASGKEMLDERGNLIEIVTDSDNKKPIAAPTENGTLAEVQEGEYETAAITYPGVARKGKTLENQYLTVEIPRGWEQNGNRNITLKQTSTGAQITFYPNLDGSLDSILERQSSERDVVSDIDFQYTRGNHNVGTYTATFERMVFGESVLYNYYIWTERSMLHEIACVVPIDQEQNVDFDVVLQTVRFK